MFKFPFSTLHELNLDWILAQVKKFSELIPPMETAVEDVQELQTDVEQAVEDANTAIENANAALETAEEAKEIAEQAAQGTIADGAVTTPKIANNAVTNAKMADDAINTANIIDGSITEAKLYSALANKINTAYATVKRNFIFVGDSFSVGVTTNDGGTYTSVGGWGTRAKATLQNLGCTVYFANDGTPMPGVSGFSSSLKFLTMLQAIENDVTDPDSITDIIVLGGTNDLGLEAYIENDIEAFVAYANNQYPNAVIAVGCIGSYMGQIYNNIAPKYKHISDLGGVFIDSLMFLMCDPAEYCYDGVHLTQAGYENVQPYILQAILTYSTFYNRRVDYTLTLTNASFGENSATPTLAMRYSPHTVAISMNAASSYCLGWGTTLSGSMHDVYTISTPLRLPVYYDKIAPSFGFVFANGNTTHLYARTHLYLTANYVSILIGPPGFDSVSGTARMPLNQAWYLFEF